nr:hypothetical protein [Tanacetum cinerariifolium]
MNVLMMEKRWEKTDDDGAQWTWPVRTPRHVASKLAADTLLLTWQGVIQPGLKQIRALSFMVFNHVVDHRLRYAVQSMA